MPPLPTPNLPNTAFGQIVEGVTGTLQGIGEGVGGLLGLGSGYMSEKDKWIVSTYKLAQRWSQQTGIPPEVYVSILASETNYGKADSWFGIKGTGTAGSTTYNTHEVVNGQSVPQTAQFAKYNNPDEAHADFIKLISTSPRYREAWNVWKTTGNWQALLQGINQAGYATDPQWAQKITSSAQNISKNLGTNMNSVQPDARIIGGASSTLSAQNRVVPDGPPKLESYWTVDEDNNPIPDYSAWGEAMQGWAIGQKIIRDQTEGPEAQFIEDTIKELELAISAGNLNVAKASGILGARMDSYKTAMNTYQSDLFKYGAPVGAQYHRYGEPGGLLSRLGLPSTPLQGTTILNPMEEAMKMAGLGQELFGGINVPSVPSISGMRSSAPSRLTSPPTSVSGGGGQGTPTTPPAPPSLSPPPPGTPQATGTIEGNPVPNDPMAILEWMSQRGLY